MKCGKRKGKFRPLTGHEGSEGELRHISTFSLILMLDGSECLMPCKM